MAVRSVNPGVELESQAAASAAWRTGHLYGAMLVPKTAVSLFGDRFIEVCARVQDVSGFRLGAALVGSHLRSDKTILEHHYYGLG